MSRVVAYTYDADMHCVECTQHRADVGLLRREPPLSLDADEHGLAYDLVDREGNKIHPVFATNEGWQGEHCGECGRELP